MTKGRTRGLDLENIESQWGFKGKNYLYTIGIDKYKHWPPLQTAVKDVEDFINVVTGQYQFEQDDVINLKDQEATVKNIMSGFRQLVSKITEDDNLVIYFSGHGHYDEVTDTGYWIPVDAQRGEEYEHEFINTAVVVDRLKRINSLHTLLIIDSCFSGTLITQIRATPRSERYKSRRVFTSGGNEVVSDGNEGGNSPFSRGILYHLKNNTNKYIRASKLILDVTEYLEKEAQQTPKDARLINADDQGGDFVFYLKMSEAEIWAGVRQDHTKEAYKNFMEQFPESEHLQEAKEEYDWLDAEEEESITGYSEYLNTYRPDGKYTQQAIKKIKSIEEEEFWEKAGRLDKLSAYHEYLAYYPDGEYVKKAEKIIKERSGKEVRPKRIDVDPTKKEFDEKEKQLWNEAKEKDRYVAYLQFIEAFPESRFVEQARQEMKRLDHIALNQIRLAQFNKNLTLQQKIQRCLDYFNAFPGAENNTRVKQIKDRLQIQKYSKGHGA